MPRSISIHVCAGLEVTVCTMVVHTVASSHACGISSARLKNLKFFPFNYSAECLHLLGPLKGGGTSYRAIVRCPGSRTSTAKLHCTRTDCARDLELPATHEISHARLLTNQLSVITCVLFTGSWVSHRPAVARAQNEP